MLKIKKYKKNMGDITFIIGMLTVGVLAGVLSGSLGIGGGIVIIPILVYIFGFSQHMSQGTTLALMVPPIGLLAAYEYYKNGNVNITAAVLICIGFVGGTFLGSKVSHLIPDMVLKKAFGVLLLIIAIKMIFWK